MKRKNNMVRDIIQVFFMAGFLSALTFFIFRKSNLNYFFYFLGCLFLLLSGMGIFHKIDLKTGDVVMTGSASAIFFFLSWAVPNLAFFNPVK